MINNDSVNDYDDDTNDDVDHVDYALGADDEDGNDNYYDIMSEVEEG